jgi:hypothetical protein
MKKDCSHIERRVFIASISVFILLFWSTFAFSQWTVVTPPAVSTNWALNDVFMISDTEGWAVGWDHQRGVLLHYLNGKWDPDSSLPSISGDWYLFGINFFSSTDGWAVGYDKAGKKGALLSFTNGSWKGVTPPVVNGSENWDLMDIALVSSTEGWAVGQDYDIGKGVFLHLINGNWTLAANPPSYLGSDWYMIGLDFITAGEGWAVGNDTNANKGVLFHYKSGSWTFSSPTVSSNWFLNDLFMISATEGWAVGYDGSNRKGVILHYLNGEWKPVSLSSSLNGDWSLLAVNFLSSTEGWAVGFDQVGKKGVLIHYLNGNWSLGSIVSPPNSSNWEIRGVYFTPSGQGWAVGWDHANTKGIILSNAPSETISTPDTPTGPANGDTNTSYTYTTGGAVPSVPHPLIYRFDWGDGTKSDLPIGQTSGNHSWRQLGTYEVKALAYYINEKKETIVSKWSEGLSVDITGINFPINPVSPAEGTTFDACSYYTPPTFEWTADETFKNYEIRFSLSADFSKVPIKVKASNTSIPISSSVWKRVLLLPGAAGGMVYWKVVGTRLDKTPADSETASFTVSPPQPVQNPGLSTNSRSGLPQLTWENACNIKFKTWFGNLDFVKKTSLNLTVKNPTDNGGLFQLALTARQWETIRKLVGDKTGETIYWYVESWDGLRRYSKTDPMNFALIE